MAINFKKKLGLKKLSKPSGLKSRFKKRSENVLEKIYKKREERSSVGGMGKNIFNKELMDEYGLEEFQIIEGDHFVEILPISDDENMEYFLEISQHTQVGFANDKFICMHIKEGKRCYRCEQQSGMWDIDRDKAISMYPRDRCIYLIWERTKELIGDEEPTYQLMLWNAPKGAVHKEISSKARNKISKTNIDISCVDKDEGKTVGFEINKVKSSAGTFPQYSSFELHPREHDIPEEILEQVAALIDTAKEEGYDNAIELFLHIPTYEEVKESADTESLVASESGEQTNEPESVKNRFTKKTTTATPPVESTVDATLEAIQAECEEYRTELKGMNLIAFRKWCRENEYEEALEIKDRDECVNAIIEDMFAKMVAEADINY